MTIKIVFPIQSLCKCAQMHTVCSRSRIISQWFRMAHPEEYFLCVSSKEIVKRRHRYMKLMWFKKMGQVKEEEITFSVFLCSETKRIPLLRRLCPMVKNGFKVAKWKYVNMMLKTNSKRRCLVSLNKVGENKSQGRLIPPPEAITDSFCNFVMYIFETKWRNPTRQFSWFRGPLVSNRLIYCK